MEFKISFSLVWEPKKEEWKDSKMLALECAQALQDITKVKELIESEEKKVPQNLRNSGWEWIPPFGKEWEDPYWESWTSPGLYWRNDAGYIEICIA